MFGPSGFFTPNDIDDSFSSQEMELIHSSKDGFNDLYRVSKNGRFFIYKALKPEYAGNIMYEDLLRKDFNIGFSLQHGHICQYYAYVNIPEIGNAIVMEWIDGLTLEEMIPQLRKDKVLARKIIHELCSALDYMSQKQVYHRDLKPENIMVTHNGHNVKIIDFGLSDTDSYGSYKAPAGTRMYASPELLAGEQIDGRSDIWSLGIILRELGMDGAVVKKSLMRNREDRYTTASQLYDDLISREKRKPLAVSFIGVAVLAVLVALFLIMRDSEGGSVLHDAAVSDTVQIPETDVQVPASQTGIQPSAPGADNLQPPAAGQPSGTTQASASAQPAAPVKKSQGEVQEFIDDESLDALLNEASGKIR